MYFPLLEFPTLCCDALQRDDDFGCVDLFAGLLEAFCSL